MGGTPTVLLSKIQIGVRLPLLTKPMKLNGDWIIATPMSEPTLLHAVMFMYCTVYCCKLLFMIAKAGTKYLGLVVPFTYIMIGVFKKLMKLGSG